MSRLAKKPFILPAQVTVEITPSELICHGPKGELRMAILPGIKAGMDNGQIVVSAQNNLLQTRANLGTFSSLLKNMIEGVSGGYHKNLEIQGVGYRAALEGNILVLSLGYVSPVKYVPPQGVTLAVEKNIISVTGIDKQSVGQAAAQIRSLKKPEPYKGKGIRYQGEVVHLKAGKKAATAAK